MTPTYIPTERSANALTAEDLNIEARARDLWRVLKQDDELMECLTADPSTKNIVYRLHREDNRSDPLALLASLVPKLAGKGVPEAFFRRLVVVLTQVVDDCFAGAPRVDLVACDRIDLDVEARENKLQGERLIDGHATTAEMDAEADALEAEISEKTVRARLLRLHARRGRAGLTKHPLATVT